MYREPQRVFSGERKSHHCVVNQQVFFCGEPKSHCGEPKSHHYEYYTVYCTLFPRVPKYFSNPLGRPLFNAQHMRFSCCGYTCSERFIFLTCHALKRGRPERLLTQFLLKFARCAHFNTHVHPQTHGNTQHTSSWPIFIPMAGLVFQRNSSWRCSKHSLCLMQCTTRAFHCRAL